MHIAKDDIVIGGIRYGENMILPLGHDYTGLIQAGKVVEKIQPKTFTSADIRPKQVISDNKPKRNSSSTGMKSGKTRY